MTEKSRDESSSLGGGVYDRVDDPRVLVPRERDPSTGRLTRAGDDRPGKRRSPDPTRSRPRFSPAVMVVAVVAGVLLVAGVAVAVSSGGGDDKTNSDAQSTPSSTASRAGAGTAELAKLEGTWRFDIQSPRVNYVSGRYSDAQVSVAVAGDAIQLDARIDANNFHRADVRPMLAGDVPISCSTESCGARLTGFVDEGDGIRVVDRATLRPDTAGAGRCGAPAVSDAGVVEMTSPSSFRYVTGQLVQSGSDCFQVVWTSAATKVS